MNRIDRRTFVKAAGGAIACIGERIVEPARLAGALYAKKAREHPAPAAARTAAGKAGEDRIGRGGGGIGHGLSSF